MKEHRERKVKLLSFLTSELEGRMLSTSRPGRFTLGEKAPYRLNRTLGESQSQYGRFEEKKKTLVLTDI
jgi:hypothetical protein